ncbi:30S ribosomal protein S6 [Candidatus Gottesmanbacteria bacterium]|nr:30S ribosomal protein S6 [Candidatus Gottesmanbacteria bacterium]
MNAYELVVIFSSELSPEEQKKIISKIAKTVHEAKGKVLSSDEWGKKTLSYPIKKNTEGYYWLLKMEASSQTAVVLNNLLKLEDKVIRYMLVQ